MDDFHCGLDSGGDCRRCLVYGNPVPALVTVIAELLASEIREGTCSKQHARHSSVFPSGYLALEC